MKRKISTLFIHRVWGFLTVLALAVAVSTPAAAQCVLVCNNLVQVSLDQNCEAEVLPDMILEGGGCPNGNLQVQARINNVWVPANGQGNFVATAAHIGQTIQVRVRDLSSTNSCWGFILVEDKIAPVVDCDDILLSCAVTDYDPTDLENLGIAQAFPDVVENCGPFTQTYTDIFVDLPCGGSFNGVQDLSAYVQRKWTVTDASGNTAQCTQYIYFERRHAADVTFPADITIDCSAGYNASPAITGVPYITDFGENFPLLPNNTLCELNVTYTDQLLNVCPGTRKVLRTWTLYDWCLPNGPQNPLYHVQLIKFLDSTGPTFDCPEDLTVSTNPNDCEADVDLPDVIAADDCGYVASVTAMVVMYDPTTGQQVGMVTVGGNLTSFPGNNLWISDTLVQVGYANNLPIGTHEVTYTITDACGNQSTCTFDLTVEDLTPPNVACDEHTVVALGVDGMALVNASTFDDGSYDNCNPIAFKVRRMNPNACQDNTYFVDQAKFCCSDIGDTIQVILRVYDIPVPAGEVDEWFGENHYNDCMVLAVVQDKIKPACISPANLTVSCENFDETLWAYGLPQVSDNCCFDSSATYQGVFGLTHTANYQNFDTVCNKGTILRTFRVEDCYGNTTTCTQRVVVNYEQDYYVRFPNDVLITFCDSTGVYGQPTFFGEDCELLATSFEDEVFVNVPDACYKIERTWHVINWCYYNPNQPLTYVPNPNPHPNALNSQNFPGPVVASCTANLSNTPAAFLPTVVKINPTDPIATNYCQYWSANTNGYEYKQIIKIIDQQNPVIDCPASPQEFCDYTANDPLLWNDMFWYDPIIDSHDLCEGPTDLTINATDLCSGNDINVSFQLFLDLNGDGVMETVVASNEPSTWTPGFVRYGNAQTANFQGGTLQQYDFRPVLPSQYYRFGLQTSIVNGKKRASVRWFTQTNNPNVIPNPVQGIVPELPYGTHKIKWFVNDNCGNTAVCEYNFVVKDCKKPTVVCINGLSANLMNVQGGMITLWASDFYLYGEDNCTPADQLKFGIRRVGTGTGFPFDAFGNPITSVSFTCADLGTQAVEVWAIDAAGNADFCETYVLVQDNMGVCGPPPPGTANVAGALMQDFNNPQTGVEDVEVQLTGPGAMVTSMSTSFGTYGFNAMPINNQYLITPVKDNDPMNGVSTFDLVLISRHILGLEPLNTPYKMISADANRSGSITTFDIVELRKLILGIYTELPANTSWRFIRDGFTFTDVNNPFIDQFEEDMGIQSLQSPGFMDGDFVAMKVGDVNGSAIPNSLVATDDRSSGTLYFNVGLTSQGEAGDRQVSVGEEFTVEFKADANVAGYQFTANTDGLEVIEITGGDHISADNFAVFGDAVTTSVDLPANAAAPEFTIRFRATKAGLLSELLSASSRITKAEAYALPSMGGAGGGLGEKLDVAFRFTGQNGTVSTGAGFELLQNTPNPVANATQIAFNLPEATTATLRITTADGRVIRTISNAFVKGLNTVTLQRSDLQPGVLFYQLDTPTHSAVKKMIVVE